MGAGDKVVDYLYLNDGEELGVVGTGAKAPPCTLSAAGQAGRMVPPRFRWTLLRPAPTRRGCAARENLPLTKKENESVLTMRGICWN